MFPTRGRGRVLGALGGLVALAGLALLLPRPAAPQAAGAKVMFLEPKNVAVSLGSHHIPHWGTA